MRRRSDCANMRRQCACAVTAALAQHGTTAGRQAAPCRRMRLFGVLHCAAAHGFALRRCSSCASPRGTGACSNSTCRRAQSSRRRTPSTSNPARPSHGADTRAPAHWRALARKRVQCAATHRPRIRAVLISPHVCSFVCLSVRLLGLFVCLFFACLFAYLHARSAQAIRLAAAAPRLRCAALLRCRTAGRLRIFPADYVYDETTRGTCVRVLSPAVPQPL
jgi:hypothetical protein